MEKCISKEMIMIFQKQNDALQVAHMIIGKICDKVESEIDMKGVQ